jgi:zinc/manganese transport system permease protein
MYELLIAPFVEFAFMQRALAGALIVAIAAAPVGVFLVLRRMSLMGDALAHGVLPGVAAGFLLAGLSIPAMTAGGFVAGLTVALAAGFIARATNQREESSLAALYLIALAGGVDVFSDLAKQSGAQGRIVSSEAVIAAAPELIVASWCGKKVSVQTIRSRPGWR